MDEAVHNFPFPSPLLVFIANLLGSTQPSPRNESSSLQSDKSLAPARLLLHRYVDSTTRAGSPFNYVVNKYTCYMRLGDGRSSGGGETLAKFLKTPQSVANPQQHLCPRSVEDGASAAVYRLCRRACGGQARVGKATLSHSAVRTHLPPPTSQEDHIWILKVEGDRSLLGPFQSRAEISKPDARTQCVSDLIFFVFDQYLSSTSSRNESGAVSQITTQPRTPWNAVNPEEMALKSWGKALPDFTHLFE
ncbi:hypothetical protein DFH09DRAFT_1402275 [Mycena vulgaris]|nr:hypothetical protein DFH09DRAFT_1402275 [Mycena vulgaris]